MAQYTQRTQPMHRCKQWIQACGRPELLQKSIETLSSCYGICDIHFHPSDRLAKKLKTNAIPTLNLPHQENLNPTKSTQTLDYIQETGTQTNISLINNADSISQTMQKLTASSPLQRESLSNLKTECIKGKTLDISQESASASQKDCNMSSEFQKLIDLQNRLKRNSRGDKYDKDLKLFALNVYLASPLAYRVLAKTLRLPSERSLRQININIGTKLSPNVLKCLEAKSKKLKVSEKICIICADIISLKRYLYYQINEDKVVGFHEIHGIQTAEPATHAFVIMARGIYSNWKQPLAYCFLGQNKNYRDLRTWLDSVISQILRIGFLVVALVSDHCSFSLNMADERNVTVDKPYFFIEGKKIYYIFDVLHLIKSVRNSLIKYEFEFSDTDETKLTAKWEDVKTFYKQDCDRPYRLAPKLTESHINPNKFETMEVKYATQVFSKTVAAALNFSIECGRLEKSSLGTVKLIELMDKTFDVLNSSALVDPNKYKIAFAAKPYQTEVLDKLDLFLSNVTVRNSHKEDVTNAINSLRSLKITVNSIKSLSQDLRSNGSGFLFTRWLNQEPLELFFDSIRQQNGNRRKPTPIQFRRAFRKFFMVNMLKHSEHTDCTDNLDQLLMNTNDTAVNILSTDENTDSSVVAVGTTDYRFNLPKENAFVYVCGYLLKKCFDIHRCKAINKYVNSDSKILDDDVFKQLNSFNENTPLINPPASFVICMKAMDSKFQNLIQNIIPESIGNEILKKIHDICVTDCCSCFPNLYLQKLFVRFRIYNTMRFNNTLFRDKTFKQKKISVSR